MALLRRLFTRRQSVTVVTVPQAPAQGDPFRGHPMYCKCYHHH